MLYILVREDGTVRNIMIADAKRLSPDPQRISVEKELFNRIRQNPWKWRYDLESGDFVEVDV
jgi:hypothetical protein